MVCILSYWPALLPTFSNVWFVTCSCSDTSKLLLIMSTRKVKGIASLDVFRCCVYSYGDQCWFCFRKLFLKIEMTIWYCAFRKKDSYRNISESLILMILDGDTIAEINKDKLFLKPWKKFPLKKTQKKQWEWSLNVALPAIKSCLTHWSNFLLKADCNLVYQRNF